MKNRFAISILRGSLVAVSLLALGACSGGGADNDRRSVNFADTRVSWINFAKVSDVHRQAFDFGPGESLYLFSRSGNQTVTLSNGAVVEPGGCIKAGADASSPPLYNTAIWKECEAKVKALPDVNVNMTRSQLIALAERAVRQEGSCQWQGFDAAVDARARAIGAAARLGDDRFFFAKMTCR